MAVVSVHIADVGVPRALRLIRNPRPASIPGLLQGNVGCGATFGTTPARLTPGRLGLIAFWNEQPALDRFEATHPLASELSGGLVVHARPLRAHGSWPGLGDDVPKHRNVEHDGPVLVLTLANTRFSRAVAFSRSSAPAEKAVVRAPGNAFSSGIVRPPFMSTVSLWESSQAAMDYAYNRDQAGHPEAIAANRAKPFHHQQAFVRLAIDEVRGSLGGHNPLPAGALDI